MLIGGADADAPLEHQRAVHGGDTPARRAPARASRRTMRPAIMIAACDATASPSSTLCVTSTSAAPADAQRLEHVGERRAADRVEPRVRLVEQHDRWPMDDRRARSTRAAATRGSTARTARPGAVGDVHPLERVHRRRLAVAHAVQPRRELHVLARGERADRACSDARSVRPARAPRASSRSDAAAHRHRPRVGLSRPAITRSSVVFPAPFGPKSARQSPAIEREVDAVDGAAAAEARG